MAESKGQTRQTIEEYVNNTCAAFLEPHSEFISITCKHRGTDETFLKVVDAIDNVRFFNATDMTSEAICEMVVELVKGDHIAREIVDKGKRRDVSALFR